MTREEEIKCASKDYVNYLLDKQEYHNGNYTEDDIRQAFVKGAIFADNNPDLSSLWHDASEEPEHNCTIAYATKNNKIGTLKRADKSRWRWYMEKYSILMWAYISDLLPKGGKL